MVTLKQKTWETPKPNWVIQRGEALAVCDRRDIANNDEPMFVDWFSNKNYFAAALHEGGITGVEQDKNDRDKENDDDDSNTYENPYKPPVIALDTAAARR